MAAANTVSQSVLSLNSVSEHATPLTPRHGVVTLYGYGISARVDRGHLVIDDGIGALHRRARFSRVGHGLRRLVVIGCDGFFSLAALRWLADQKASLIMLDRCGTVLVATGPVGPSDARLRRAQARAHETGAAMSIVRELVDRKLAGQELLAHTLQDSMAVETIATARRAIYDAPTPLAVRQHEAQAALAYWSAWRNVPVLFPRSALARVPDHWRVFGARRSPVSNSPRVAVNPPNAMLNYLYALLEAESRLAAVALGLDPGLGVLHVDTDARDSFACDLMEAVRPQVDAYVLAWLMREPLSRDWFFEERNGNCRLMAPFAARLADTASGWGRAVAPVAEWTASVLWSTVRKPGGSGELPTRLTQHHRRAAKGNESIPEASVPRPPRVCRGCGTTLKGTAQAHCDVCNRVRSTERLIEAAVEGRRLGQTPQAQAKRAAAIRRNKLAESAWNAAEQPTWLTPDAYAERIQPRLEDMKISALAAALGVSKPYAIAVRAGRKRPHPRHWLSLARLVGFGPNEAPIRRVSE